MKQDYQRIGCQTKTEIFAVFLVINSHLIGGAASSRTFPKSYRVKPIRNERLQNVKQ